MLSDYIAEKNDIFMNDLLMDITVLHKNNLDPDPGYITIESIRRQVESRIVLVLV